MKIVNAHVHMIDVLGMLEKRPNSFMPSGIGVYENLEATVPLLLPSTLLKQMDEAGIETSILYAVEAPILFSSNAYVHKLCKQHPDRLIGFASVDPLAPNAVEDLARAILDYGLKGLKFHPPLQDFYPNDERIFPVYEKAVSLNIPVVFHVGTTPFGALCKLSQADPLLIDDVANSFPALRIMLTHLSTLWQNSAFMVVEKHPNVFIDTAAYLYEIPEILDSNLVKRLGQDKIIFGTDYPNPFAGEPHNMKSFVDCILSLNLDDQTKDRILNKNIEILLRGRKAPEGEISFHSLLSDLPQLEAALREECL